MQSRVDVRIRGQPRCAAYAWGLPSHATNTLPVDTPLAHLCPITHTVSQCAVSRAQWMPDMLGPLPSATLGKEG